MPGERLVGLSSRSPHHGARESSHSVMGASLRPGISIIRHTTTSLRISGCGRIITPSSASRGGVETSRRLKKVRREPELGIVKKMEAPCVFNVCCGSVGCQMESILTVAHLMLTPGTCISVPHSLPRPGDKASPGKAACWGSESCGGMLAAAEPGGVLHTIACWRGFDPPRLTAILRTRPVLEGGRARNAFRRFGRRMRT